MPTSSYRLYGAPSIFLTESLSSWLQRLSQQQGLSIEKLFSFVDVDVPNDFDSADFMEGLKKLIRICELSSNEFQVVDSIGRSIRAEKLLQKKIRKSEGHRPSSAFCPACLNTDPVPYYRVEWRFLFWEYCPQHKLPLLDSCQTCDREVMLDTALLLSSAPAPNLAYCQFCFSRLGKNCESAGRGNQDIDTIISVQRALMAGILNGYCKVVPFDNRFSLEMMFRLHELDLLLAAKKREFCQEFDSQRIRVMRKFLWWMQIRVNKKDPIFEILRIVDNRDQET